MNIKLLIKKITPNFIFSIYHFVLAFIGALIYRFPSRKITVIGITGTKGKSSALYLAGKMLESSGLKVGWVSSLSFKVGPEEWLNPYHMTMPGRFRIQQMLRKMVNDGCKFALIEVTSEGIKQYRHKFIDFDCAVFTNLAPEHIEAHGSFEKYMKAKGKLFASLSKSKRKQTVSIINLDDAMAEYFLSFSAKQKIGFRLEGESNDKVIKIIRPGEYSVSDFGAQFLLEGLKFNLHLSGLFNLYNALAAIAIANTYGAPLNICQTTLDNIKFIAGRMEEIKAGQNFRAIVDLAHTPDSFLQVLEFLKNETKGNLICVFGSAGGGRDKWKRPELGKIAGQKCSKIILTNEDPYNESPKEIIDGIVEGVKKSNFLDENLSIIFDRKSAIEEAIKLAKDNDTVVFLGKGTEATMVLGDRTISWDEKSAVIESIKRAHN